MHEYKKDNLTIAVLWGSYLKYKGNCHELLSSGIYIQITKNISIFFFTKIDKIKFISFVYQN